MVFVVEMTRVLVEDIKYLPDFQKNWVSRFVSSDIYGKFLRAKTDRSRKGLLDRYLTELVRVLKDPRSEIAFLRKFLDRENKYVFVFDKARREAKQKILSKKRKPDSSAKYASYEDLVEALTSSDFGRRIKKHEILILKHILAIGWDNGMRLVTILRINPTAVQSDVDCITVSVREKNSGCSEVGLMVKIRPDSWNAAARLDRAQWPNPQCSAWHGLNLQALNGAPRL